MARVRIHTETDIGWHVTRDSVPPENSTNFSEGELSASYRIREPGGNDQPQLMELRYLPGAEVQVHAHDEDEIIFIVDGEMHLGSRVLGPGTSIAISGRTFYGFKAGPAGLQFLNFRPRQDTTFYTTKESMAG
jgi:mannose-6-phosphate isomerase-like protein (cupin superfamily)